ncbi:Alpha/Beta hydrolase protein [Fusarium oxysporum]|nr:Alpha/Beta hydrolase protein [Fusarium oxysporum]
MDKKEYTFKREAGVSIEADVYFRREQAATKSPIALYFHGGNFTVGSKALLPAYHRDRLLDLGFTVVSANYRLCPTIRLYQGPVKDALDAYEWVRLQLPELLKEENVDVDNTRIVVLGHSCGATLALLTAGLSNPPKAILDIFGMKYLQDPEYHAIVPTRPTFDQAFIDQVHKDVPPPTSGPSPMGPNGPDFSNYRIAWMFNAINTGSHVNTIVADGDFARVDPAFLLSKNDFPPTYFVHGTEDTLVKSKFSEKAHKQLISNGIESELVLVQGGGHGLDARLVPGDETSIIIDRALDFLKAHV